MPSAEIVDTIIVKLGLDPSNFNKGQKEAARAILETEKTVKKSSDSMGKDILGFTGKLLGVATAAIAIKKVAGYVGNLSTSVRQLGIDSRNLGIAADQLKNFQNVGEMFGGKAEDVTKTIGGITKAVYDLAYNGQINDSLVMLGRLGVKFQDTSGNARDFIDIAVDAQAAIQRSMKEQGTSRQNATQMLAQAGFDPGLIQAMLDGKLTEALAKQEGRRQVSGESITAATAMEQSAANRDQALDAASLRGLPAAAVLDVNANNAIAAGADFASNVNPLQDAGSALSKGAKAVEAGVGDLVDSLNRMATRALSSQFKKGRAAYESVIQEEAKRNGINPEVLAGILKTESNFDPAATNASGAVGIAQLMPKYFPTAGRDPYNDIGMAAKEFARLKGNYVKKGMSDADATKLALQAYNAGETRLNTSSDMGGKGAPLRKETLDYPNKVLSAPPTPGAQGGSGGGNSTSSAVNIGKVEIHTQSTDAGGIARDIVGATKRKGMAAQAEAGMS